MSKRLGWVLIHRKADSENEGPNEFQSEDSLEKWLDRVAAKDRRWHWRRAHPLKCDGPYRILFGFNGKIWGDVTAEVTHKISRWGIRNDFNFAFRFLERPHILRHRQRPPIPLEVIVGSHLARHHRNLVVLRRRMLVTYTKMS